jgi:type II secretory pathway pseudopilin PulG
MIVIAIIAIIAAIAIPNLLESRITANEASAGTSLKAGVFPAQVQFQAGGYVDNGGPGTITTNGIGDFACRFSALSGQTGTAANGLPTVALALLPTVWSSTNPNINSYLFGAASLYEANFCAGAHPSDGLDSIGRRCFAINAGGTVYATAPASANGSTKLGTTFATLATPTVVTGVDVPFGASFIVPSGLWSPYKR